ncbi:MAG: MerR family transcriptional regulator [Lachnospiraceae bacterium]|nr:MerR family transcriptional regulator [Lachnospiraceae bacterium]
MSYSSGEVCDILNVSLKTLRLYEQRGLVHPRRDADNRYRKYEIKDLFALYQVKKYQTQGNTLSQIYQLMHGETFEHTQDKLARQITRLEDQIRILTWQKEHLKKIYQSHAANQKNQFHVIEEKGCDAEYVYECIVYSDRTDVDTQKTAQVMSEWRRQPERLNIFVIQHLDQLKEADGNYVCSLGVTTIDSSIAEPFLSAGLVHKVRNDSNLKYPMAVEDPFRVTVGMAEPLLEYYAQHDQNRPDELHMYYNTTFRDGEHIQHLFTANAVWKDA